MRRIGWLAGMLLVVALLLAAGCSGGTSSSSSGTPVISDLALAYGPACTAPNGKPGLILAAQVQYADDNGNIDGGTLNVSVLFTGTGETGGDAWRIPQDALLVTGSTAGIIQVATCVRSASPIHLTFTLTDGGGSTSNALAGDLPATHR